MKTDKFTLTNMALIGMLTELTLIAVQFIYLTFYVKMHPGVEYAFTTAYIKSAGFYIFQIAGLVLYAVLTYFLVQRLHDRLFYKLAAFVIAGGLVELAFYLSIQAQYEGAFLYSVFNKVFAVAVGLVLSLSISSTVREKRSFFS